MKVYHYSSNDALIGRCPFNEEFLTDSWVAFHGTSNHAAAQIESQGISWQPETYSKSNISAVLDIFDQLHWSGQKQGGFGVLASFAQSDFNKSNRGSVKPVFLAETSFQSVLYASREFAGGETARALRLALSDLHEYLNNPAFRKKAIAASWKHLRNSTPLAVPSHCIPQDIEDVPFQFVQRLWEYFDSMGSRPGVGGRPGVEPYSYSEPWLQTQLAELEQLHRSCDNWFSNYQYGVIYAIRFTDADLPHLASDRGGLVFDGTLSPDRIVAKAIISPDVGYPYAVFEKSNKRKAEIVIDRTGLRPKLRIN